MNHMVLYRKGRGFLRFVCVLLLLLLVLCSVPVATVYADEEGIAAAPHLVSQTAVVIDAETGQVLYQKQKDQKMAPASITKIISAIVAVESGIALDEQITMSYDAVFSVPRYSSHIALDEGEKLTMEDALYAMMLASANDAANGIAEKVAGSNEEFVVKMNELAQKVGAVNTHFTNPHGLIDNEHYTTAYDMALLTRYAMQNEAFLPFFTTITYEMAPTNKQPEQRVFSNQNEMIKNTTYKYEGAFGGKLGYTEEALYTIVTVAEREGRTLICVCMRSDPYVQQYADAADALDYAFNQYKKVEMTADDLPIRSIVFEMEEGQKKPATAQILTTAESVYYLPRGLSADDYTISFNYSETGNQLKDFAPKAVITIHTPTEGVPSVIEVPLEASITAGTMADTVSADDTGDENTVAVDDVISILWNIIKWVLLVILLLFVLLILIRIWVVHHVRKKRQQRLARQRRRGEQLRQREAISRQNDRRNEIRRQMQNSSRKSANRIDYPIDRNSRY